MLRTPRQQSQIANQLKFVDPKVSIISCIDNLPNNIASGYCSPIVKSVVPMTECTKRHVCYKTSELWTFEKSGSKKEIRAAEE